jgi:hypothetical protein
LPLGGYAAAASISLTDHATPLTGHCPPQHRVASSSTPRQGDALNGDREQKHHHTHRYEYRSHAFPLPAFAYVRPSVGYSIGYRGASVGFYGLWMTTRSSNPT